MHARSSGGRHCGWRGVSDQSLRACRWTRNHSKVSYTHSCSATPCTVCHAVAIHRFPDLHTYAKMQRVQTRNRCYVTDIS